jgi:hypothetical protein
MPTLDDRLKRLEVQRVKITAEIGRLKSRHAQEERKRDTRRKLLVGALVLELVERGEWPRERLMEVLDRQLTRDIDRALFGLPPRKAAEGGKEPKKRTGAG